MGLNGFIKIAVTLAIIAAGTGNLPKIIYQIRLAQLQLLKESQASKWGHPLLLPITK